MTSPGCANLPRGARVRVKLGDIDEITLDVMGTVVERLDAVIETGVQTTADDEDDDDEPAAGPIAIAVDMSDAASEAVAEPQAASGDNPAS